MATYQFNSLKELANFLDRRGDSVQAQINVNKQTTSAIDRLILERNTWYQAAAIVRNSEIKE